ncbi:RICIN domain-containing protein [Kutzneria buriramensis]|uniref:Ricin-type beta-trefoil lectin protein n=1 Tax=Kutzneria buriramensis TaxID=1045776 RepID=A0A3E0GYR7_9PSEU|nr:RICIN domain-containing protein [Kutzneria buriramensis]REH32536.1 ricin-type beta-trefoil lectin protein [Kutzneria buriramensis]
MKLQLVAAAAAALAAAVVPTVASAQGAPAAPHSAQAGVTITSPAGGLCLTIAEANNFHGAEVDMENCTGAPNQRWSHQPGGLVVSDLTPAAGQPQLCLDDRWNNPRAGAAIDVYDCHSDWPAERWTFDGSHEHNANGLCLDITDANPLQGAAVKLFGCTGVNNQNWHEG